MDRTERAGRTAEELFGRALPGACPEDPALETIIRNFTFGDVYAREGLSPREKAIIPLAVLTAVRAPGELPPYTAAALRAGLTAEEIKEALYQCAPYVGYPGVREALGPVNRALAGAGAAEAAAPAQGAEDRFSEGLRTRAALFGQETYRTVEGAPEERRHIQEYLCAYCFGDFYTRPALELKTRELLTLCILTALGGCESQLKAHVRANQNAGNPPERLIAAVTHCIPFVGFPKVLNALGCIQS